MNNKICNVVKEILSLTHQIIELNRNLYSELYDNKEDDNNERE